MNSASARHQVPGRYAQLLPEQATTVQSRVHPKNICRKPSDSRRDQERLHAQLRVFPTPRHHRQHPRPCPQLRIPSNRSSTRPPSSARGCKCMSVGLRGDPMSNLLCLQRPVSVDLRPRRCWLSLVGKYASSRSFPTNESVGPSQPFQQKWLDLHD